MPNLSALLSPASVAVVGASPDAAILRGRTLKVMLGHRFDGRIYPINRSHAEVQGLKAYPSVEALPEKVDLAVLIIPAQAVPEELERCGTAGVRAALILASGFAEEIGAGGDRLQQQLCEIAGKYDMAVCGPNSEGFANMRTGLCPTFSPALDNLGVPLIPEWRQSGHIAVVSQSGGVGFSFFDRGRPKELPFSHVVTTGNEACLDCFDIVEHLLDEGSASVFILFIETIRNAETFRRVARKALAAGKPIVVAKVGQSEAGRRAAASHTAALAGEYESYRAMFRHYGIAECADSDEMVDVAGAFSMCSGFLPKGNSVGIATPSGGAGGWLADACMAAGLQVPQLDTESRKGIDAHIPSYGTSQNPVDGTAQAIRKLGYAELARLVAASPRIDAVISVASGRAPEIFEREHEKLGRLIPETGKPILIWSYTNPHPTTLKILSQAGIPLMTNMRTAARAIAAMAEYRKARERFSSKEPVCDKKTVPLPSNRSVLAEHESMELLGRYGVRGAKAVLAKSAEEAVRAAAAMEGPVALKIQSPDIAHKTEAGGVILGVQADGIRACYEKILGNAKKHAPNASIHGVLVQAMAKPGVETILGVKNDPKFGPLLLAGLGGIAVEVLRDAVLAPVPLAAADARDMLARLRARAILDGIRGKPPADVDALVELMVAVSRFAADHADRLAEADLNPVIVHPRGEGVTVVDALIVLK